MSGGSSLIERQQRQLSAIWHTLYPGAHLLVLRQANPRCQTDNGAVMSDCYGGMYYAMPGGLPARLRMDGISAAAEQTRFLARMARPAVTDMTS